jgi:hypothetical protein
VPAIPPNSDNWLEYGLESFNVDEVQAFYYEIPIFKEKVSKSTEAKVPQFVDNNPQFEDKVSNRFKALRSTTPELTEDGKRFLTTKQFAKRFV